MFAVFKNGGKQYKACENQLIKLDRINANLGDQITFNEIMLFEDKENKVSVGSPFLSNISMKVEVIDHGKDDKIIIFKKKRRKNHRRKNGHRQDNTLVKVISIDQSN